MRSVIYYKYYPATCQIKIEQFSIQIIFEEDYAILKLGDFFFFFLLEREPSYNIYIYIFPKCMCM